jgi:hypothetical protein
VDEPPAAPAPSSIGPYQVLERLDRGGMGVVYKARHSALGRVVALKVVLDAGQATAEERARFVREAEAIARLDHSNVVPIYDVGEHEGCPYFAMKLMEGGSLRAALLRLQGAPRAGAALVAKVARAVHHAHERGIVHRDLKPGNILLDRDGEPCVADFGLAGFVGRSGDLTRTGAFLGTLAYAAPEVARGGGRSSASGRLADVYGLGVVLFELLTGRRPFQGDSTAEVLRQVLDEPPPRPAALDRGVPRDLEVICLKCLDKEPGRRYASAAELADDLERFLAGRPITARPASALEQMLKWARRRPAAAALIVLAVLAAVSITAVSLWYSRELAIRAGDALAEAARRWHVQERVVYAERLRTAFDSLQGGYHQAAALQLRSLLPEPGTEDLRGFEWRFLDDRVLRELPFRYDCPEPATGAVAGFSPDGSEIEITERLPDGRLRIKSWRLKAGGAVSSSARTFEAPAAEFSAISRNGVAVVASDDGVRVVKPAAGGGGASRSARRRGRRENRRGTRSPATRASWAPSTAASSRSGASAMAGGSPPGESIETASGRRSSSSRRRAARSPSSARRACSSPTGREMKCGPPRRRRRPVRRSPPPCRRTAASSPSATTGGSSLSGGSMSLASPLNGRSWRPASTTSGPWTSRRAATSSAPAAWRPRRG